jgi:hypothetical protein
MPREKFRCALHKAATRIIHALQFANAGLRSTRLLKEIEMNVHHRGRKQALGQHGQHLPQTMNSSVTRNIS